MEEEYQLARIQWSQIEKEMVIVCQNCSEVRDELSATENESMLLNEKCIQTGRDLSPNVKEMTDGEVSAILVEGDLSPKEPPKEGEITDEEVSAILMSMSLAFIAPATSLFVYSWMLSSTV